jgi:DNA-binding response OmpR family regulator
MTTNSTKSILIIEDDPDIRNLLSIRLRHAGYTTLEAANGTDGLRVVHEKRPSLVILDIGLPGMDGWQVLQRIRDITTTPVMILSARGLEAEKVRGLQSGADDYVTKPFGHQELVARIGVLLRRATDEAEPETEYADPRLQIDIRSRSVVADGVDVKLTPGEFRLLLALIQHVGQILSPEQLLQLAWDDPTTTNTSRVKFTVLRLRRKLGWDIPETSPIESVRGFGYRYRLVSEELANVTAVN